MDQMQDLLISVLNMSITASYAVLLVCIIRILLKKAPKVFSYALWSVVLFRLICPISFSSFFSFLGGIGRINVRSTSTGMIEYIPRNIGTMKQPQVELGVKGITKVINGLLPVAEPYASVNPMQINIIIMTFLWIAGMILLLTYSITSYLSLKNRVSTAMLLHNNIYESDQIDSPFVLGFLKPRIYIPVGIREDDLPFILGHEQTHIAHKDHLIKLVAFLALIIHWFNPVIWYAYWLMTKDMEMSCDEKVIKELGTDIKANYSRALLAFALKKQKISKSPLAFGESNTKERIKNVIKYKRPTFWLVITAVIACLGVAVACAANPRIVTTYEQNQELLFAKQLYDSKTKYVGYNSRVSSLIQLLPVPSATTYRSIELLTSEPPYGLIIHYDMTNDLMYTYESEFIKNSILLFATVNNVDTIKHTGHWKNQLLTSDSFSYVYTRAEAEELLGRDVRDYNSSEETLEELLSALDYLIEPYSGYIDYPTIFTLCENGNDTGLFETHNQKVATELAGLLLSGNDNDTPYSYEFPETNDYLKISIGDNNNKIYYIFEENSKYYVMKPKDYINELPKESYDAIFEFISTVTVAEPVK
jgi:beta-lactamase regulating signal transducer with metallopeptidase domain